MKIQIKLSEKSTEILEELVKIEKFLVYAYSLKISDTYTMEKIKDIHGHFDYLKRCASSGLTEDTIETYLKGKAGE